MNASSKRILAICGSTRLTSANLQIIQAVARIAGTSWQLRLFDISTLPYFNQDVSDEQIADSVQLFRKTIAEADGVLICTPEYVFSLPGILKNALEWTVSTVVFQNKPTALITASSSGHNAHESLLLVMSTLSVKTSEEACLLVSGVKSKLNATGRITDPALEARLKDLVVSLNRML